MPSKRQKRHPTGCFAATGHPAEAALKLSSDPSLPAIYATIITVSDAVRTTVFYPILRHQPIRKRQQTSLVKAVAYSLLWTETPMRAT